MVIMVSYKKVISKGKLKFSIIFVLPWVNLLLRERSVVQLEFKLCTLCYHEELNFQNLLVIFGENMILVRR